MRGVRLVVPTRQPDGSSPALVQPELQTAGVPTPHRQPLTAGVSGQDRRSADGRGLVKLFCWLFGHAAPTLWHEPWRPRGDGWQWRWIVSVCPRCWSVVARWAETQKEGT